MDFEDPKTSKACLHAVRTDGQFGEMLNHAEIGDSDSRGIVNSIGTPTCEDSFNIEDSPFSSTSECSSFPTSPSGPSEPVPVLQRTLSTISMHFDSNRSSSAAEGHEMEEELQEMEKELSRGCGISLYCLAVVFFLTVPVVVLAVGFLGSGFYASTAIQYEKLDLDYSLTRASGVIGTYLERNYLAANALCNKYDCSEEWRKISNLNWNETESDAFQGLAKRLYSVHEAFLLNDDTQLGWLGGTKRNGCMGVTVFETKAFMILEIDGGNQLYVEGNETSVHYYFSWNETSKSVDLELEGIYSAKDVMSVETIQFGCIVEAPYFVPTSVCELVPETKCMFDVVAAVPVHTEDYHFTSFSSFNSKRISEAYEEIHHSGGSELWLFDSYFDHILASSRGFFETTSESRHVQSLFRPWADSSILSSTGLFEMIQDGSLFDGSRELIQTERGPVVEVVQHGQLQRVQKVHLDSLETTLLVIQIQSVCDVYCSAVALIGTTFSLCLVVVSSVASLWCCLICSVLRSFDRFRREIASVRQLDLTSFAPPTTWMKEMRTLSLEFAWMVLRLKRFKSFLPADLQGSRSRQSRLATVSSVKSNRFEGIFDDRTAPATIVHVAVSSDRKSAVEEVLNWIERAIDRYGGTLLCFSVEPCFFRLAFGELTADGCSKDATLIALRFLHSFALALSSFPSISGIGVGLSHGTVSIETVGSLSHSVRRYVGYPFVTAQMLAKLASPKEEGKVMILADERFRVQYLETHEWRDSPRVLVGCGIVFCEALRETGSITPTFLVIDPFDGVVSNDTEWMYVVSRREILDRISEVNEWLVGYAQTGHCTVAVDGEEGQEDVWYVQEAIDLLSKWMNQPEGLDETVKKLREEGGCEKGKAVWL